MVKKTIMLLGFLGFSFPGLADQMWDFSGGNTDGWSTVNPTLSQEGWEDYYLSGFETPPRNYVKTETVTSGGNTYDCLNVSGQYAKLDIAGQFGTDRLASYVGGSLHLAWTDSGHTDPTIGGELFYAIPEYILMTGTVGGREVMLGYQLPLSSNPLIQQLAINFTADQFAVIDRIAYGMMDPTPEYTFGNALSDAEFAEFMSTCDAMYIRSLASLAGGVGGSDDYNYHTKIANVSFRQLVPEPSSSGLTVLAFVWLLARRRQLRCRRP